MLHSHQISPFIKHSLYTQDHTQDTLVHQFFLVPRSSGTDSWHRLGRWVDGIMWLALADGS